MPVSYVIMLNPEEGDPDALFMRPPPNQDRPRVFDSLAEAETWIEENPHRYAETDSPTPKPLIRGHYLTREHRLRGRAVRLNQYWDELGIPRPERWKQPAREAAMEQEFLDRGNGGQAF